MSNIKPLRIKNHEEFIAFMHEVTRKFQTATAIKGPAPKDATYSNGVPINHPINVAWVCDQTGERFDIIYEDIIP